MLRIALRRNFSEILSGVIRSAMIKVLRGVATYIHTVHTSYCTMYQGHMYNQLSSRV
jgi:hypothetical protein